MRWNFARNGTLEEYTAGVRRVFPASLVGGEGTSSPPVRGPRQARTAHIKSTRMKDGGMQEMYSSVALISSFLLAMYLFIRDDVNFLETGRHDQGPSARPQRTWFPIQRPSFHFHTQVRL